MSETSLVLCIQAIQGDTERSLVWINGGKKAFPRLFFFFLKLKYRLFSESIWFIFPVTKEL